METLMRKLSLLLDAKRPSVLYYKAIMAGLPDQEAWEFRRNLFDLAFFCWRELSLPRKRLILSIIQYEKAAFFDYMSAVFAEYSRESRMNEDIA
jgi:hypothetical protein